MDTSIPSTISPAARLTEPLPPTSGMLNTSSAASTSSNAILVSSNTCSPNVKEEKGLKKRKVYQDAPGRVYSKIYCFDCADVIWKTPLIFAYSHNNHQWFCMLTNQDLSRIDNYQF